MQKFSVYIFLNGTHDNVPVRTQNVRKEQFVAIPISIQRFVKETSAFCGALLRKYIRISFSMQREQ